MNRITRVASSTPHSRSSKLVLAFAVAFVLFLLLLVLLVLSVRAKTATKPAAPLGQMDFIVKGLMIGGFALAASPAEYGVTGVKSFIVSHDGVVYEKDLGRETLKTFAQLERFNPDKTWSLLIER